VHRSQEVSNVAAGLSTEILEPNLAAKRVVAAVRVTSAGSPLVIEEAQKSRGFSHNTQHTRAQAARGWLCLHGDAK
jgi:hypothetical protein